MATSMFPATSSDRLEEEYRTPFTQWQAQPTKENTATMLNLVRPTLQKGVQIHAGGDKSPVMLGHARQLALQAMQSYDPKKASLNTHLLNHLRGLRRISQRRRQPYTVPERIPLEMRQVHEAKMWLQDELGRDPSDEELADRTSLSVRRLAHLRRFRPAIAEGYLQSLAEQSEEGGDSFSVGVDQPEPMKRAIGAVYHELDPVNQKILEWSTGFNGQPQLQSQVIARRLRLSPGAISQRKAAIQRRLDEAGHLLRGF